MKHAILTGEVRQLDSATRHVERFALPGEAGAGADPHLPVLAPCLAGLMIEHGATHQIYWLLIVVLAHLGHATLLV